MGIISIPETEVTLLGKWTHSSWAKKGHSFIHLQTIIEPLICALSRWSLCPGGGDRQKCNEGKNHAMKEEAHNEME